MLDESPAYRVAVKDSAKDENQAVRELAHEEGDVIEFPTKAEATQRASELSDEGDMPVKIQRVSEMDPADVDAYLVGWPQRRKHDPDGTVAEGLTFDTGANQYGALGEALVLSPETNPPLLTHYAKYDPAVPDDAEIRVELDTDPEPVVVDQRAGRQWQPDCRAKVRVGSRQKLAHEYWCEVKAGDGSFERSQREGMKRKAQDAPVLKIRVDVTELPQSYTAWVRQIAPDGTEGVPRGDEASDDEAVSVTYDAPTNARLDDF
ncbi:hypothetical protein [Halorussus halophilus]|uniref:hypothetical protein n=1 Tax=Halorussus halophilus TaxID=2650975 RepID=UPI00130197EB|nr:hypothetical protein [Halorussus halophilus]